MATYIPGVTDYIPQIQQFQPDYNFYNAALQMKQSKYDAAREQLSTLYGSLLNNPLTRDENLKNREDFFKIINQDIKKMSGLDLSLKQNQESAEGIFNQLLDDKSIAHDMVWTRGYFGQVQKSEALKNCGDPEKCDGQWWEGGDRMLQYKREEYRTASKEEAMKMGIPKYVSYQNIYDKAVKIADKYKLNVTQSQSDGKFIWTYKNGQLIEQQLASVLAGALGSDPKVNEYYNAMAYVRRNDFIYSNLEKYGSKEVALHEYMKVTIPELEKIQYANEAEKGSKENKEKLKKVYEAIEKNKESDIPSFQEQELAEMQGKYEALQELHDANVSYNKQLEENIKVAGNFGTYSLAQVDALVANLNLQVDISNAARTLSYRDAEAKIDKADPYAMENYQFQLRRQLEADKFGYQVELEKLKAALKGEGGTVTDPDALDFTAVENKDGASANEEQDLDSEAVMNRGYNQWNKNMQAVTSQSINGKLSRNDNEKIILKKYLEIAKKSGAKKDIIELVENTAELYLGDRYEDFVEDFNERGADKYKVAMQYLPNFDNLDWGSLNKMYNIAEKKMQYTTENGVLNPQYKSIGKDLKTNLVNIKATDAIFNRMFQYYVGQRDLVADKLLEVNGDKEVNSFYHDAIKNYINDDGDIVSRNTWIRSMQKKWGNKYDLEDWYPEDMDFDYDDDENIHNLWRQSYSQHGTVSNGLGWVNLTGAGNYYAMTQRGVADPTVSSDVIRHTLSFMRDGVNNSNAVVRMGKLPKTISTESDPAAEKILATVLNDLSNNKYKSTDTKRPKLDVSYTSIAGGNEDWIAMNIKLPAAYITKYQGGKDNPGVMRNRNDLVSDGFTIMIPKASANNSIAKATTTNAYDLLLNYSDVSSNNPIDIPYVENNKYVKDFKFAVNRDDKGKVNNYLVMYKGYDYKTGKYVDLTQSFSPGNYDISTIMNSAPDYITESVKSYNESKNGK